VAFLDALRALGDVDGWDGVGLPRGAVRPDPDAVITRVEQWLRDRPDQKDALLYVSIKVRLVRKGTLRPERPGTLPLLFGD
jgi:hypothetical protein